MTKDNRVKGCSNIECERYSKKYKYKSTEQFCSLCGYKLTLVCKECFRKIEDVDFKHKICASCEAKKEDNKENTIKNIVKAAGVVSGIALTAINRKR